MLAQFLGPKTTRLMGALAIPTAIMAFWFYAHNEANKQVQEFNEAQKVHPNTDQTVINNYELKEVDDNNQVHWLLAAKRGALKPVSHDVDLVEVHVDYMDGPVLKMRVNAPIGKTNEITRLVKLSGEADKKVIAMGEGGKVQLEAKQIELDKKNDFNASGDVNIVWPGVAKVIGDMAAGSLASANLNNVKIIGHTHALIGSLEE